MTTMTLRIAVRCLLAGLSLCALPLRADPYPRQPIDVEHYRFVLTLADSTDRIHGDATIRVRAVGAGLASVWFDLASITPARQGKGMRVSAVTVAGAPADFQHAGDRVTITLGRSLASDEVIEVRLRYAGLPADGLYIRPTPLGDRAFFSDNWPDKGHHWIPLIDHVADKATMEMSVLAPSHYQVISNGRRMETTDTTAGLRRTVWRESVPISPWLYALGVAAFAVQQVDDYAGIPIETWVFAKQRDAGFHDFAVPTRDALAFYSEYVGPFSYEKLANVQSNSVSGGMEAASAIFYSAGSVAGTRPVRWRNVVIHEIAHQWFGDAVTERDWNDVWLSEGFATYFTLLFIEHAYGHDEFVAGLHASRKTVIEVDAKTPDRPVIHRDLTDMAQVTSAITYQKGSWALHMLRSEIGDDRFWAGIRDYYARHRDRNATTADFRAAMERASGRDLGAFFEQWLRRGDVPAVTGRWRWDAGAKQVVLTLHQAQAGAEYALPIEVGITMADGSTRIERADLSARSAEFRFAAGSAPRSLELDPRVRLLAALSLDPR
ncbi:MAG: M1 family metallopeptidase [Gemmatimonadaceae bacterium]|nr:M1 family metallopeptidase [Gemmatimonadaceae bacterium]